MFTKRRSELSTPQNGPRADRRKKKCESRGHGFATDRWNKKVRDLAPWYEDYFMNRGLEKWLFSGSCQVRKIAPNFPVQVKLCSLVKFYHGVSIICFLHKNISWGNKNDITIAQKCLKNTINFGGTIFFQSCYQNAFFFIPEKYRISLYFNHTFSKIYLEETQKLYASLRCI